MFLIKKHPPLSTLTCAVVIPCHNYGRYLGTAIESVNNQTHPPEQLIVVDDASTDNTKKIASQYDVHYIRTEYRNEFHARAEGFKHVNTDVVCFLDADDILSANYLEEGLKQFNNYKIGIVYSDIQSFGSEKTKMNCPTFFDRELLHKSNYMHAGSLVKSEALLSSLTFEKKIDVDCLRDWCMWRSIIEQGWVARRQPATYHYRKHNQQMSEREHRDRMSKWGLHKNWIADHGSISFNPGQNFYDIANLKFETVTLFIPLSGRNKMWKRLSNFLNRQKWPKDQIQLILMDTSGNTKFNKKVSNWAARSDYPDVRIMKFWPGEEPGSADEDRFQLEIKQKVQRAVARIYNMMSKEVATPYIWVLEDDVIPPDDCCEFLLRQFNSQTMSVTAAVPSRLHDHFLHWGLNGEHPAKIGEGVEQIRGNGFGCVILRREIIKNEVFTFDPKFCHGDYDVAFYARSDAYHVVNWNVLCEHG